ncbi:hypothetical protein D9M73_299760 [compost metagenome]
MPFSSTEDSTSVHWVSSFGSPSTQKQPSSEADGGKLPVKKLVSMSTPLIEPGTPRRITALS